MKSKHDRKFVCGGVALVMGRLKNGLKLMPQDEVEKFIINSCFLEKSPFLWVALIYRYGIKNDLKIKLKRINKTYGDLPIDLELDMEILQWADKNNLDLLHDIFMIAALEALIQVGEKYKLPIDVFKKERSKYGTIPNTIEECKAYINKGTKNVEVI